MKNHAILALHKKLAAKKEAMDRGVDRGSREYRKGSWNGRNSQIAVNVQKSRNIIDFHNFYVIRDSLKYRYGRRHVSVLAIPSVVRGSY
jgi:hypothetical protein